MQTRIARIEHRTHAARGHRPRERSADQTRDASRQRRRARIERGQPEVERGHPEVQRGRDAAAAHRDGNALLLPSAQLAAALAHLRVVAARQAIHDKVVRVRHLGRRLHLLLARALLAVRNVLGDRPNEERRLLPHEPDLRAQPAQVERPEVLAVEHHHAALRV
eukprot:1606727-Prymnesium_polylepis.1